MPPRSSVCDQVLHRFRLRGELRANFERIAIDNVTANYLPGFGEAIEPLDFFDLTPRFSVEHRRDGETVAYASAARGSRSGGINAIPGLLPGEQGYDPETNWTYELSGRLPAEDGRLHASATVFYVDWDNAQITGFSNSPGVGNLITLNTGGVTTRGLELSVDLGLPRGLELGLDCAYADPRFRSQIGKIKQAAQTEKKNNVSRQSAGMLHISIGSPATPPGRHRCNSRK